jgi:hypothetical protein
MIKRQKNSLKFLIETETNKTLKLKIVENTEKIKHFSEILKGRINYS